jgi:CRP-like cAMP-binding protein
MVTQKSVFTGTLGFLTLGDVLQLIGSNGGTGVLQLRTGYSTEPGAYYFSKGNIIHASAPGLSGLDAAYALFGWTEGEYEFLEGDVDVAQTIQTSRMEIILDGLRMVDDGETAKLGPVSYANDASEDSGIPVIKGPLVDYIYVVDEESFYQGRRIVQEQKHGSWIWVILEGMVDIIKETPDGPLTIIRLGSGAFIGGVTSFLFSGNVRTATAVAASDVQLGVLDSPRMAEEFGTMSPALKDFVLSIDRRRTEVTERTVEVFCRKANHKAFIGDKKPLVKQGDKGEKKLENRLIKIVSGEARVVQKNKYGYLPLANLGSGDFIGPVPFLDLGHEPHRAGVYASPDLEVEPVDAGRLQEEYEELSSAMRNLVEGIATSISVTNRVAFRYQKRNAEKK